MTIIADIDLGSGFKLEHYELSAIIELLEMVSRRSEVSFAEWANANVGKWPKAARPYPAGWQDRVPTIHDGELELLIGKLTLEAERQL